MPQDEDPMPLNGNAHPLPGEFVQDPHFFALPPFPALLWNDVPPPSPPMDEQLQNPDGGWGWPVDEPAIAEDEADLVKDHESMVLDEQVIFDSV